ncbi:hypothetical protein WSM22_08000 [Cytophagales bacterium WSM2-2]|nr:hypothetical protein WSM22_08000 [Cytophagales bacterium WSM2-2]
MKSLKLILAVICLTTLHRTHGQTFTSSTDGAFSTNSNWSGGTAPPLSGQSYGSVTVQNNMSTSASYTVGSFDLNVSANKSFTINGNLTLSNNGGHIYVSGTLTVTGTLTADADANSFIIYPGGKVIIVGNATINHNGVIQVGTSVAPAPYADLVFESNVNFASGGAGLTVNQNGRVAVYGNLTSTAGGGQVLQINNGGQVYVNGNINLNGNGDQINANNTSPYGLYVNGTTTNSGGGSSTTAYKGTKASMQSTNPSFYAWVKAQPNSPLPIVLISFDIESISEASVQLKWVTASEINFDYFELERSTDGKNFADIGHIQGHGTTQEQHSYEFADNSPVIGTNYYRLKSIDFDGYTETFSVVMSNVAAAMKASVYPNPLSSGNSLHIDLNFVSENYVISVTDVYGNSKLTFSSTDMQNAVPVSLGAGIYLVTITSGKFSQVSRLVIN